MSATFASSNARAGDNFIDYRLAKNTSGVFSTTLQDAVPVTLALAAKAQVLRAEGVDLVNFTAGEPEAQDTFEKLYDALLKQIRFSTELSARAYQKVCQLVPRECPFLLASLLTDDCLAKGKGILEGSRYIGGCVMGSDASHGVIDSRHRVFGYRNLFVVDGSAVGANLGVNPSLTITALAERAMTFIPPKTT